MHFKHLALSLALAQDPTPSLEDELAREAATRSASDEGHSGQAPATVSRTSEAEQLMNTVRRMNQLTPEQKELAIEHIKLQFGKGDFNRLIPGDHVELNGFLSLPPHEQAQVVAKSFFDAVVDGNASAVMAHTGFPFFLEGRRYDKPDELQTQWSRSLRSRRTDLLKVYGVEVMTPTEMERKYGKAPARLASWPLKNNNTFIAVGNLSGKASVVLLRQAGVNWQVIGWHD